MFVFSDCCSAFKIRGAACVSAFPGHALGMPRVFRFAVLSAAVFFPPAKGGITRFRRAKNDGRKCFADPQAPSGRRGCLRPEPLLSSVPIPLPRSIPASPALGPVLAFLVGTPAVAGAMSMRLKQTDAMIKSSNHSSEFTSSFAASAFHSAPPPWRNGSYG